MNKFEKLIEYVINEEDGKASDLFHEIVLEKKNSIYKKLIKEDEKEEASEETNDSDSGETSNEDSNNFKSEGDVFNGSLVPAPEPVADEPSDTYTDTVISDDDNKEDSKV